MAKHKYEFRPDKPQASLLNKLYLTEKQRMTLLRWFLFSMLLLVISVLQDVIMCRFSLFGATTDLVPCTIILMCVLLGSDSGSLFALFASLAYQFSGSSPGYYVIVLITFLSVGAAMFRQSYLRKSFSADMLCAGVAVILYEVLPFGVGLLFVHTRITRWGVFLITGGLSLITLPILYPIVMSIAKIGGETWKE